MVFSRFRFDKKPTTYTKNTELKRQNGGTAPWRQKSAKYQNRRRKVSAQLRDSGKIGKMSGKSDG